MENRRTTATWIGAAISALGAVLVTVLTVIQAERAGNLQSDLQRQLAAVGATSQVQISSAEATTQLQIAGIEATAAAQRLQLDTARSDLEEKLASVEASIDQAQLALEQRRFDAEREARRDSVVKECVPTAERE